MKKIKNSAVFTLSALSAALISHSATIYASDIEIYKAPTVGGASLMLSLDNSQSMVQEVKNKTGGYGDPIANDFGITCGNGKAEDDSKTNGYAYEKELIYEFFDKDNTKSTHKINGRFCNVKKSDVDSWSGATSTNANKAKAKLITDSCLFATTIYRCPDRLTTLKMSLFELIIGSDDNDRLPDTALLGFRTFPTEIQQLPLLLTDTNRKTLLNSIATLTTSSGTPIAKAYSQNASNFISHINGLTEASCAGYGIYFLTDGAPSSDNTSTTTINRVLASTDQISSCSGSWECVLAFAEKMNLGKNTISTQIKTAIVGFGKEFGFTHKTTGVNVEYDPEQLSTYTDSWLAARLTGNALTAAKAGVKGEGGWYTASNKADIVSSVENFVTSIKVPIPAITTGTATIPQDQLNAIAVQPYAYFPQFKPQPSETFQLWSGNLKKYKVVNAVLKDKDDANVFGTASGTLNTAAKDLWVKGLATDSALINVGGMLGKLNLKATSTAFNRKVLTNAGTTLSTVDETYIKGDLASRKYLLGLLGYDLTEAQLNALTAMSNLTSLSADKTLRNLGAVMHSTPVLLTQEGKVEYVDETSNGITTSKISTATRDDYLLFGTTQGVLHVVKVGAESDTAANYSGGNEVFAFVPQETLANQPRALLNEAESGSNGMNQLYYGMDGQWVTHTEYVYNSTSDKFLVKDGTKLGKQWVYGGMRMGGRSYYALDLTDMSSPAIKFRIDPATSKVYSPAATTGEYSYSHLSKMGESWSKPVIANVQWQGKRRLVMFVGGGYDRTGGTDGKGYETFNYVQTNGLGAGVFMFDANTGEPLWSTYEAIDSIKPSTAPYKGDGNEIKYSIVSQIKAIDREGDGDVDHLYFGDLGGQVFRIDLNNAHSSLTISSTATETQKTAAINSSKASFAKNIVRLLEVKQANGLSPRFYEAPGFSIYSGTNGNFAVVSIGSGNRSNPLLGKQVNSGYIVPGETAATNSVMINDAVYNLFDVDVVKKDPTTFTLQNANLSNLAVVTDENRELGVTPAATAAVPNPSPARKLDFTGKKGWYYAFASSTGRKAVEKAQGDVIVIDNDLYVSTFDAEAVGSTEACGAGIYGASKAHRFCMPYGQCPNGDTTANNKLTLGKGLLGITLGGGTDGNLNSRSIVAPLSDRTTPANNKILGAMYSSSLKLTPLSWYEKN